MTKHFVTIATFTTPLEAELVKARLEDEGVAAFVFDAEVVTADWTMSTAIGGVKVKVPEPEAERARSVLAERLPEHEEPYDGPTEAEDLAHRAFTSALLGLTLPPLLLYSVYLLFKYAGVARSETPRTRRKVVWALFFMILFSAPWMFIISMF